MTIQIEAVMRQLHAITLGHFILALLNHIIVKLDHATTVQTDQVIMVFLMGEFEDRFAAFKMVAGDDPGIIKLVQDPVHGCQADLFSLIEQLLVQLLRTDVLAFRRLQILKDLDPRGGDLQAGVFKLLII